MSLEFKTVIYEETVLYGRWIGPKPKVLTAEEILTEAANDGWEFCGYIPGRNFNLPAEHWVKPMFMFKREKP